MVEFMQEQLKSYGRMKSFNYKKGFGFIHEVDGFPNDIYVGKEALPLEWQVSETRVDGLEVRFALHHGSSEGKAHARNIQSMAPPESGAFVSGTVKSWNPVKGFGFFSVDGLSQDVFFAKDRIPVEVQRARIDGVRAVFQLQQKHDGKFEALQVTVPDMHQHQHQPQRQGAMKRPFAMEAETFFGEYGPPKKRAIMASNAGGIGSLVVGDVYTGVVKSYNVKNQYGFIACQESCEDIMFRQPDLSQSSTARRGDDVSFTARMSPHGKGIQAANVVILGTQTHLEMEPRHREAGPILDIKTAMEQLSSNELSEVISYGSSMLCNRMGGRRN